MRRLAGFLVMALVSTVALAACLPAFSPTVQSALPAPPARLVLADSLDPTQPWQGSLARPVDPDTLVDLPGFAPVDLAICGSAPALRPNGRVIAVPAGWLESKHVTACNVGGGIEARLFDLEAWTWGPALGVRADYLAHLAWSPDGRRLYAITTGRERSELGGLARMAEVSRLWIADPTAERPPASAPLPFGVYRFAVAPDGSALVALGFTLDPSERSWIALDPAFLAVLDPETGAERTRVALPGLKVYQRRETGADGQPEYRLYYPDLALSPGGERAYVARADEPLLDVVDLRAGRIERTVRTDRSAGAVERLLDLFARPAAAKGGPTASKQLSLSPDGRWLYVSGAATSFEPTGRPNEAREVQHGFGITALDTGTWQVRWSEPALGAVTLSPDGSWLYLHEPRLADRPDAPPESQLASSWEGARLQVLEATTGRAVATLTQDRLILQVAPHGTDRLYVALAGPDFHLTQPYRAGEAMVELLAFEVGSWRELARRTGHLNLRVAMQPW